MARPDVSLQVQAEIVTIISLILLESVLHTGLFGQADCLEQDMKHVSYILNQFFQMNL